MDLIADPDLDELRQDRLLPNAAVYQRFRNHYGSSGPARLF